MILEHLGDKCFNCGTYEDIEFNHIDGCTWDQRALGRAQRWRRYAVEIRTGVGVNLLCRHCNGGYLNYPKRKR